MYTNFFKEKFVYIRPIRDIRDVFRFESLKRTNLQGACMVPSAVLANL